MVFNVGIRIKNTFRIAGNLKIDGAYITTHFVLERHIFVSSFYCKITHQNTIYFFLFEQFKFAKQAGSSFCVFLHKTNRAALAWIYDMYVKSFGWDIKPRCSLHTHAFKFKHRLKRTWMTKRKSRGPGTHR